MSSILKALRKVEEEKASPQGGSVDIARDILRLPRRRRTAHWRVPASIIGAVVVLGVAGFSLIGRLVESSPEVSIRPASPPAPSPAGAAAYLQPSSPPAASGGVQEVLPADVPVRFPVTAAGPAVPTAGAVPGGRPLTVQVAVGGDTVSGGTGVQPAAALLPAVPPMDATVPEPSLSPAPAVSVVNVLSLAVTGIVFHADPEARMAVVNGLPVMPGTVLDGVTVEEILPDRVRFSNAGRTFDVPLSH